ncbi:UTRA domain-containing protein [Streptomyces sp. NPDC004752]
MTTHVSSTPHGRAAPGRTPRVPKYYQVKQQVRAMTDALTPGSRTPAERLRAVRLDTSCTTVRQASRERVGDGRQASQERMGESRQASREHVGDGRPDRARGKRTFAARPELSARRSPRSHRPLAAYGHLLRSLATHRSLYPALTEAYGVRPAKAEEVIGTSLATPREAVLLATEVGLPMPLLSCRSRDAHGTAMAWVRSVYRGSRCTFTVTLMRPAD